jgi:hypothetical protein
VALVRNRGETLHQLLNRVLVPTLEDQIYVDEINRRCTATCQRCRAATEDQGCGAFQLLAAAGPCTNGRSSASIESSALRIVRQFSSRHLWDGVADPPVSSVYGCGSNAVNVTRPPSEDCRPRRSVPHRPSLSRLDHLLATAGNYRICIGMAAELLMTTAQREITVLDEKLYLQVFAPPESQATRRASGR